METLNAKQWAIKNAYGEYWENVKDYVDNILNTKDDINPLDYQKS